MHKYTCSPTQFGMHPPPASTQRYEFAGAKVQIQAMLVLYAQGLVTGVVLDSGDGVTHVVPVWDNTCPAHLIKRLDVAGRHVTRYMVKLLQVIH